MRKVLRIAAGIGLIIIGIIGLILPVMPGWVFIIPGLVILGDYFPPAKRLVDWLKARFDQAREAAGMKKARDLEEVFEPGADTSAGGSKSGGQTMTRREAADFLGRMSGMEPHFILHDAATAKVAYGRVLSRVQSDGLETDPDKLAAAKQALGL